MGEACERSYEGCCLGYGPPIEEGGFFYDMSLAEGRTLSPDDHKGIEDVCKIAVKEKQPFERLELPKEVLMKMFEVGADSWRGSSLADLAPCSTTNSSSTTSIPRSPMERRPPSTNVAPSSICVSDPMFPIPAESSLSPSSRWVHLCIRQFYFGTLIDATQELCLLLPW
jgi:hypothetical protein